MKKLLSLSLMLSLGLATVTPALNAAQSQSVAESQANPADASGWQAAKKWWQAGRKMSALNPQEQRAFKSLMKKFTIRAIILAILAMLGGAAYKKYRSEQEIKALAQKRDPGFAVIGPQGPHAAVPLAPQATGPVVTEAARLGKQLIEAAKTGKETEVERLIAAGANVNATQDGYTALMWAAREGYKVIVGTLLKAGGINVNAEGPGNITALILATSAYDEYIAEDIAWMLLKAGANKRISLLGGQMSGHTAEEIARIRGRKRLAYMISQWD